jgi:D-alanyl-D-alanine carboxypeptidase/D-alanyl-D-alanine-endopeptidase (penicillin-binding protein 4)
VIARCRRIAIACALPALASCGAPGPTPHGAGGAAPEQRVFVVPRTPVWSRRDVARLDDRLRAVLAASALATSGIAVVDASGRSLFARRAATPLVPASTFKLLAAATALHTFGPAYRFPTTFEALSAPADGIVRGDLYLVGSGDPTLTRDDVQGGVGVLARAGISAITGGVVADASAFSPVEVNAAWDPDDVQYGYAAGTSALSLDQGTVEFHLVPGAYGVPASIDVRPPSPAVHVSGDVVTASTTLLSIERSPASNDFRFDGQIATGAEQSFWRPVVNLPRYAAVVTRAMLEARGITVAGPATVGTAPLAPAVLWTHRSAPLHAILREMLVTSNNHFAEQLLRAVGTLRGVGSERTGAQVERALLARDGVPQAGLRVVDGSGLAPSDRVAPITLATLLARAATDDHGAELIAALPRVGIEGTVRWRHLTAALGRARAKSGHITGVNALAGYVMSRHHGRLAFAVLVNDVRADDGPVDDGIDAMLDVLARS